MTTQALGLPEILTTANDVRICGTTIERPPAIAPSQWLAFWQRASEDNRVQDHKTTSQSAGDNKNRKRGAYRS